MQSGDVSIEKMIRSLVQQELARAAGRDPLAAGQVAGEAGAAADSGQIPAAEGQPWLAPRRRRWGWSAGQPGPAGAGQSAAGLGGTPPAAGSAAVLAGPTDQIASAAQEALAATHAEITQAMARNLEKLRTVLMETEQIATRMEEILSQQARHGWQQEARGQSPQDGQPQGQYAIQAVTRASRPRRDAGSQPGK